MKQLIFSSVMCTRGKVEDRLVGGSHVVDGVREVLRLEAEGGVSDVGGSALSL